MAMHLFNLRFRHSDNGPKMKRPKEHMIKNEKSLSWRNGNFTLRFLALWALKSQKLKPVYLCHVFEKSIVNKILSKGGKTMTDLLLWVMAGCVLLLHVLNKLRQTRFPPPAS